MDNYTYQIVSPAIADYVRTVLLFDRQLKREGCDLPLFTGKMAALFCRIKGNQVQATLYGESVADNSWKEAVDSTLLVFFFRPFAMAPIFKLTARQLKKSPVRLNAWSPQKAMALNIQLLTCRSSMEQVNVVTHFIHTQIERNKRDCELVRFSTDQLMQNSNGDVLAQILNTLNVTERTFQRVFKKYVGLPPNEYRRICQFYFAFAQLKGRHFDKLTDVAYDNGYFDQSHFIRSFREFADISPNEYLQHGLHAKEK